MNGEGRERDGIYLYLIRENGQDRVMGGFFFCSFSPQIKMVIKVYS